MIVPGLCSGSSVGFFHGCIWHIGVIRSCGSGFVRCSIDLLFEELMIYSACQVWVESLTIRFYLYDLLMTTTIVQDAAAQVVIYLWVFLNVGSTTCPDH